ncbi:hypothetical protein A5844_000937 [Enterococcus sp. 10A9_DIV0425]|uniref:Cation transporter n=1 Tax=Candidatus Enterococcus wittei TaxID=1987383 RepID=A0A242JZR3_9ENTE|nr:TrkH family potassium uptake protein [Enterococcus sp. 10A9_DIV0425]OTP10803.1 hypothetical protein A5844_000937 [Enterococcus sp. 10A9_DIV0425]THE08293.1 TrkH family potassium uptake protein [Enterococcus hirae]
MKKKTLFNYVNIGNLIIVIGILIAIPLFILPFYPNEARFWPAFMIPAVLSFIIGGSICHFSKADDLDPHWQTNIQKGSLTILLTWGYGFLAGAVPFVIADQLSLLHALFEAISGWTTTGLSVMDVTTTPKIFLFHRSFMQFCGGLGFVLVILMFVQGKQSMNLYSMEGHSDKLTANLKKTAQTVFILYGSFTVIGVVAYRLLGMSFFDAINHAMCALSTGGFSTRLDSIGTYNNSAIEVVTILLMLVGTTSFAVLLLLAKGKWKQLFKISDLRFMLALLLVTIPLVTISLTNEGMDGVAAFRSSAFNVISALTTTGYGTVDFATWPPFAFGIIILFMLMGGGMGSTAGGIKLSRVYILMRLAVHNLKKKIAPTRKVETPYYMKAQGKTPIDTAVASEITGFFLTYLAIFAVGTLILAFSADHSLLEAGFEFASAFGTVGLSVGVTSATSSGVTLITLIGAMILGRLEIFIVLIGLYSGWRISKEKALKKFEKEQQQVLIRN